MTLPNFFIVGAPKCGTTAMAKYLGEHPYIFMSNPKETHFFADDMPAIRIADTLDSYSMLFAGASAAHRIVGEASVWYLYSDVAARNIARICPDARILVMVRRPDEMVPSMHQQHYYSRNESEDSLERAWKIESRRRKGDAIPATCRVVKNLYYRSIAGYSSQLRRLYEAIPKNQVRVIFFEDFKSDPRAQYQQVLKFLNVPDDNRSAFPVINPRKSFRFLRVANFLQRPPGWMTGSAQALKRVLGVDRLYIPGLLARVNSSPVKEVSVSRSMRREIQHTYRAEIEDLGRMTKRNLEHWLDLLDDI